MLTGVPPYFLSKNISSGCAELVMTRVMAAGINAEVNVSILERNLVLFLK